VSGRIAVLLVLLLLAGCGGSDNKTSTAERQPQQEQANKETGGDPGEEGEKSGLDAIAAADRHAFVQIATATSDLSTGASVLLVHGAVRPQDGRALRQVLPLVADLKPRDRQLRRLRAQLMGDLRRAIRLRSDHPDAGAARAMLADAAAIRAGLKRYSNANPAIGGVAPD
jgi:hypothetical protein